MTDELCDDTRQGGEPQRWSPQSGGAKSENGQLLELFEQGTQSGTLKKVAGSSPRSSMRIAQRNSQAGHWEEQGSETETKHAARQGAQSAAAPVETVPDASLYRPDSEHRRNSGNSHSEARLSQLDMRASYQSAMRSSINSTLRGSDTSIDWDQPLYHERMRNVSLVSRLCF